VVIVFVAGLILAEVRRFDWVSPEPTVSRVIDAGLGAAVTVFAIALS